MPTTLNRWAYQKLVDEDIQWLLNKTTAKDTLEGRHIIEIVKHSVSTYYDKCSDCEKLRAELEESQKRIAELEQLSLSEESRQALKRGILDVQEGRVRTLSPEELEADLEDSD